MSEARSWEGSAFTMTTHHGVLVGVPMDRLTPRTGLLALIHPEEAALTSSWGEARVRTFVAGRVALRRALAEVGAALPGPILRNERGAPDLPSWIRASVSHKDELAVALATADTGGHVGVDVELLSEPRGDISRHVLTERERAELAPLDEEARRRALLVRFSLKEALYKALDPYVQRYVAFLEVEARPSQNGTAVFDLRLKDREGPFHTEGTWSVSGAAVITTARVLPREDTSPLPR